MKVYLLFFPKLSNEKDQFGRLNASRHVFVLQYLGVVEQFSVVCIRVFANFRQIEFPAMIFGDRVQCFANAIISGAIKEVNNNDLCACRLLKPLLHLVLAGYLSSHFDFKTASSVSVQSSIRSEILNPRAPPPVKSCTRISNSVKFN